MSNENTSNDSSPRRTRQIPPGTYRARPTRYGLTQNEETGKPAYAVEFELRDGRTIAWFGALNTEVKPGAECSAWDITERALLAMGWDGADIREVKLTNAVNIVVDEDTYQGRTRTKVIAVDASYIDRNAMPAGSELDHLAETLREASDRRRDARNV